MKMAQNKIGYIIVHKESGINLTERAYATVRNAKLGWQHQSNEIYRLFGKDTLNEVSENDWCLVRFDDQNLFEIVELSDSKSKLDEALDLLQQWTQEAEIGDMSMCEQKEMVQRTLKFLSEV